MMGTSMGGRGMMNPKSVKSLLKCFFFFGGKLVSRSMSILYMYIYFYIYIYIYEEIDQ